MCFKVGSELLHEARDRARGRVAQRAKRLAVDVVGDVQKQVQILLAAMAVLDALE